MTKTPDDITHLSQSSIRMFLDCERMWAAHYLDELPRRPNGAMVKGSAVDEVASHSWRLRMEGYELPLDEARDLAEDWFRTKLDELGGRDEIDWGNESMPAALDSTIRMTERHLLDHAPLIQPTAVQKLVSRKLPDGRDVIGYIDALDENGEPVDVKTGARSMNIADAQRDLQPTAYHWLLGRPGRFRFFRVIDTGRSPVRSEIVETERTEQALTWFERLATSISARIDAGDYITRPGWHCRNCPIASSCVDAFQTT